MLKDKDKAKTKDKDRGKARQDINKDRDNVTAMQRITHGTRRRTGHNYAEDSSEAQQCMHHNP